MRIWLLIICFFTAKFLVLPGLIIAQETNEQTPEKIQIKNANTLSYKEIDGVRTRKLIGDVKFHQKGVTMICDSAYQYPDRNMIEAFSNIHIRQGDSIHLTGNFLKYSGNSRLAIIKEKVQLEEDQMTLNTDTLYYEMDQSKGYYKTGGVIRDSANKLTSKKGFYHSSTKNFYFKDSVRLFNPDYKIFCDTLRYHTPSEKAYFYGPTEIISDSNFLYCENGWYDTKHNKARFGQNTYLKSGTHLLYADSLFYDRDNQYGRAKYNIRLIDTSKQLTIKGEKGEYYENQKTSYVTDSVLAKKVRESDTFYLHADTLKSGYDSAGNRLLKAYYGAKTFENEIQTQCDSLVYSFSDSIIYLHKNPVLWYQHYQLTGEKVKIYTDGAGEVRKMVIENKAFTISQNSPERFNQIKGRIMEGYFRDNSLSRMEVTGNAEAIYYLKDEKGRYLGINKIRSSDLTISLKNREIETITFQEKPEGKVHPPNPENPEKYRFKNFQWLNEERPEAVIDLFKADPEKDQDKTNKNLETKNEKP